MNDTRWIIPLEQLTIDDVGKAGGKNASLGEMIKHLGSAGVRVPGGFAVTSAAYWHLVDESLPSVPGSRSTPTRCAPSAPPFARHSARPG